MRITTIFYKFSSGYILCGLFAIILCVSCASKKSQDSPTDTQAQIDEIKRLEDLRLKAGINKDVSAFDSMTADDYLQIDIDGNVITKPQMLERVKSSYAQLQSNVV